MDYNDILYTREPDGTIAKWYVFAWHGPQFAVSPVRNAKLADYKRCYHMNEIGEKIFFTRKEVKEATL